MNTVTLDLGGVDDGLAAFHRAWNTGRAEEGARISFASPELLWQVLTAKRWALLRAMAGRGPQTVRGAARLVKRDVKAVHGDLQALLSAGILRRTATGQIEFPFNAVRVDFLLKAA